MCVRVELAGLDCMKAAARRVMKSTLMNLIEFPDYIERHVDGIRDNFVRRSFNVCIGE